MAENRCSRNYHRMKIYACGLLAARVRDGYYNNASLFPSPPISRIDFEALEKNYSYTYTEYRNGGKTQKGAWHIAQANLLQALDQLAANVDEVAAGSETVITQAGFDSIKATRGSKTQPQIPTGVSATQGGDGQILTDCTPQGRDVTYVCLLSEQTLTPNAVTMINGLLTITPGLTFPVYINQNAARKKVFNNLKPLSTYYVYYFAVNTAGTSALSNVVKVVCL